MFDALFIHWHPSPIAFNIGPLSMSWYGLCWGTSIIVSFYLMRHLMKKENIIEDRLVNIVIIFALSALVGARMGQVVLYDFTYFSENPSEIIKVWHGGLASHGGIIGGFLSLIFITLIYKDIRFWTLTDAAAIVMPFVGGLIRFGNLMNSELVGKPSTRPWAFIFDLVDETPRHPTVLYESIMLLSIFCLFFWLANKKNNWNPGFFTGLFMTVVFSLRILIESTKVAESTVEILGTNISWTQVLSLPVVAIGILLLVLSYFNKVPSLKKG